VKDQSEHPTLSERITGLSRRDFLRTASAAAATAALAGGCAPGDRVVTSRGVVLHVPKDPPPLRVGVIGCGGRGTGAAHDCIASSPNIKIVALGDLFADRLDSCRKKLQELGEACQVTDDRCFVGFDNYKGVLACDLDMVILATPPGFRPQHLAAAVEAGKHIFTEKPVAVDPVGIRSVFDTAARATEKGLCIVAGTQRRHDPAYVETMKRVHDGAIGDIVAAQCYWNQGALWVRNREPGWSDMEWQCRNWLYFDWLSGDHIVEQHVHNLDVVNWALNGPPEKCVGMGGREVRTGPEYGNIFDHFSIEYEYPGGIRVLSMCRQIHGSSDRVSERLVGTKGVCDPRGHIRTARGEWKYEAPGEPVNPYVQEHADLVANIRGGGNVNELRRVAESTLTAIMGRISAYTGRELSWKWVSESSKLDLAPPSYAFGDVPIREVPVPGVTKLV